MLTQYEKEKYLLCLNNMNYREISLCIAKTNALKNQIQKDVFKRVYTFLKLCKFGTTSAYHNC